MPVTPIPPGFHIIDTGLCRQSYVPVEFFQELFDAFHDYFSQEKIDKELRLILHNPLKGKRCGGGIKVYFTYSDAPERKLKAIEKALTAIEKKSSNLKSILKIPGMRQKILNRLAIRITTELWTKENFGPKMFRLVESVLSEASKTKSGVRLLKNNRRGFL